MGPDDGIDARDLFRGGSRKKSCHKAHQLCKQIMDTLNYLLAGDLGDPRLQAILVDQVTPAPDASRLLISCRLFPGPEHGPGEILAALNGAMGLIRWEVAGAVARKRVPQLVFQVLPDGEAPHD